MKLIIQSEKDICSLKGKWIIQLNTNDPDVVLTQDNWNFYSEKRISLIRNLNMIGLYYDHGNFDKWEDFAFRFNHYTEKHKDSRFHRLLNDREIDFLCEKFKRGL
tara:strand:- start:39311 stop:39625 length:315 start_codon:yes stop_codon:yes gene_type:complete